MTKANLCVHRDSAANAASLVTHAVLLLEMNPVDLNKNAKKIWAKAQVLYVGVSFHGEPEALALQEIMLEKPKDYHELLVDNLEHENPLVIAYSIKILENMKSEHLCELSDKLLSMKNKITILEGSFSISTDLGGIARRAKINMRKLKGKAEQPL